VAFKLKSNPTFKHKVKIMTPVDGGHREESVQTTFNVLSTEELKDYDLATPEGTSDFLRRIIVKIDDIEGEDGQALPWSDELRDQLLVMPHVRMALSQSYFTAVSKARRGN
jgi:hypothetical protein